MQVTALSMYVTDYLSRGRTRRERGGAEGERGGAEGKGGGAEGKGEGQKEKGRWWGEGEKENKDYRS